MLLSFAYLAFSAVLRLLIRHRSTEFVKDVELLVLRHQLVVLGRQQRPVAAPSRSRLPCRTDANPAAAAPTWLDRDATDAAALASGTRASQVDAAAAACGASARRWSGARAGAARRAREPGLGLPSDRRRVAETRPACLAEHDQAHPACQPAGARAEALRPKLGRIPPPAGREHARLRLLHRRDALAPPLLRALLHRTRKPPRPPRRLTTN